MLQLQYFVLPFQLFLITYFCFLMMVLMTFVCVDDSGNKCAIKG